MLLSVACRAEQGSKKDWNSGTGIGWLSLRKGGKDASVALEFSLEEGCCWSRRQVAIAAFDSNSMKDATAVRGFIEKLTIRPRSDRRSLAPSNPPAGATRARPEGAELLPLPRCLTPVFRSGSTMIQSVRPGSISAVIRFSSATRDRDRVENQASSRKAFSSPKKRSGETRCGAWPAGISITRARGNAAASVSIT